MNKTIRLGINTGFAINRFPEPQVWPRIVGEALDLRYAQFTADLLNPALPDAIIKKHLREIKRACKKYNVLIEHTFTSAFTRVNHFAHPDEKLRKYWIWWFKRFADISMELGAKSMGSHPGILSVTDVADKARRDFIMGEMVNCWHEVARYAKKVGLEYLAWEPMSIKREMGETLKKAELLHRKLNTDSPLPIKFCLDIDHGDVSSKNPNDTDPYAWLERFAKDAPIIHIKQSREDKSGHHPFVEPYNTSGKIIPAKFIDYLQKHGCDDTLLLLELSFREREPFESLVLPHLKESVEYWRPYMK